MYFCNFLGFSSFSSAFRATKGLRDSALGSTEIRTENISNSSRRWKSRVWVFIRLHFRRLVSFQRKKDVGHFLNVPVSNMGRFVSLSNSSDNSKKTCLHTTHTFICRIHDFFAPKNSYFVAPNVNTVGQLQICFTC